MTKSKREPVAVQPNPNSVLEALTYYDPELQNALNLEPFDSERFERARAKSKQLHDEYIRQLEKLRSRLNQRTYARFADEREPLFDSNLFEFTFGDCLGVAETKRRARRSRTSASATFRSFDGKTLHVFRYRNIEFLRVNVTSERWFDMGGGGQIDSLLAHELTGAPDALLQHKYLFASGAAICIGFSQVIWDTHRVSKQAPARR
jgi:hypothetical protein